MSQPGSAHQLSHRQRARAPSLSLSLSVVGRQPQETLSCPTERHTATEINPQVSSDCDS